MSKTAIAVGVGVAALGAYLYLRHKKATTPPAMKEVNNSPAIPPTMFGLSLTKSEPTPETGALNTNFHGTSNYSLLGPGSSETGPLNTNFKGTGEYGFGSEFQLKNPGWSAY